MTVIIPHSGHNMHPAKRIRRTATSVMAGYCDPRPTRDVLTCLLNGVPHYLEEDKAEEAKLNTQLLRRKKKEREEQKRERDKLRRRAERAREKALREQQQSISAPPVPGSSTLPSTSKPLAVRIPPTASSSFLSRPNIQLPTYNREQSVTPPPLSSPLPLHSSSHENTPDPSISSTTSRTSSKRPRTPDDDEEIAAMLPPQEAKPRKKRMAVKKGWKGWVEGSPPPSEKLINLDAVPILQERRTRSGKNFDAIGVGKDGWV
ncbi:hypothetical protein V5O48_005592 [Marasmius crinis-equi]|uniref:Uncharacterized protein n=1 Tax=Marasmius crinis-equi TaxID=585013 RepID=A0ABR3FMM6_9AGAR